MSKTFIVTGKSSEIKVDFFPPIELEEGSWEIGLLNFETYHAIKNIEGEFPVVEIFGKSDFKKISITSGNYEIDELVEVINEKIKPEKRAP